MSKTKTEDFENSPKRRLKKEDLKRHPNLISSIAYNRIVDARNMVNRFILSFVSSVSVGVNICWNDEAIIAVSAHGIFSPTSYLLSLKSLNIHGKD